MKKDQQGISLFVVMIIVLLSAILVAMSFRSSMFGEYVVGNTAEYQRVYEAAQALVSDAELDIQGIKSDGALCTGAGCRVYGEISAASNKAFFPDETEYADVLAVLDGESTKCIQGICMPQSETSPFWTNETTLNTMKDKAAKYGQFTGATAAAKGNPRLTEESGWYWVELLPYAKSNAFFSQTARQFQPAKAPVLYRITAIAEGSRNARSVIQKVVVLKKL